MEIRSILLVELGIQAYVMISSYNYFGLEISLFQPSDSLGKLGESALICQIPSMNQHVPLGKLQFMIMGIRNADKSRPPNPGRLGSLIM